MKLLGKTSTYERIVAFMTDRLAETDLTEHEQALINRWNEAWTLLRNYNSTSDAAAILMKRFPGLSRATAYRDCSNAISIYGDISKSTKEGIKHLSTEIVKDALSIARSLRDPDTMIKGAAAIAKINGVNVTDPDLPDFERIEPHTYEIHMPVQVQKAIMSLIASGKIDLSEMVNKMSEFADEAEIIDETKNEPDDNS
jgi:hypothetical protein